MLNFPLLDQPLWILLSFKIHNNFVCIVWIFFQIEARLWKNMWLLPILSLNFNIALAKIFFLHIVITCSKYLWIRKHHLEVILVSQSIQRWTELICSCKKRQHPKCFLKVLLQNFSVWEGIKKAHTIIIDLLYLIIYEVFICLFVQPMESVFQRHSLWKNSPIFGEMIPVFCDKVCWIMCHLY